MSENEQAIGAAFIYLTNRCNLKCKHCYINPAHSEDRNTGPGEVSAGQVLDFVDECRELGLASVKLSGGEPSLREDFMFICEEIKKRDLRLDIETNGTFLTAEEVHRLGDIGTEFVGVSLDSHEPEIHDRRRGVEGCFAKAVATLRNLGETGISTQIISVVATDNVDGIEELGKLAKSIGVGSIKFNLIFEVGDRATHFADRNGIPFEQAFELGQAILEWPEDQFPKTATFLPRAFLPLHALKAAEKGQCGILNLIGLLSDGTITVCGMGEVCKRLRFGHLSNQRVADVWRNHPELRKLREQVPRQIEGVCGSCIFLGSCKGWCRAESARCGDGYLEPWWFCEEAHRRGLFPESRMVTASAGTANL